MEVIDWKQKNLISELIQGKEVATQLRNLLQSYSASETETLLIGKLLTSFEKALAIITRGASMEENYSINGCQFQPPHPFPTGYSPLLERLDDESKHHDFCRKRKRSPHWNEQVKVSAGAGLEGSLDDGHSWRKYGQKDILGASHPRGYYRCTHRHSQGCLATKQVQKSDEDPKIFQITYKGRHTCSQTAFSNECAEEDKPEVPQEIYIDAPAGEALQVKTEGVDCRSDLIFPSLAFTSPSLGSESGMENLFSGSLTPAISDSDYFNPDGLVLSCNLHVSDSDLYDIFSTPTSAGEFEFSLGRVDKDPGFPFQDLDFLSWT